MLRIGFIGSFAQSFAHAEILIKVPGVEIAGFFDPLQNTEQENVNSVFIKKFVSVDELIQSADAFDFVCRCQQCFDIAQKALKQTKHLFINPSMLKNRQQAIHLINLASEANVTLMVERSVRFHAALNAALPHLNNVRLIEMHNHFSDKEDNSYESILQAIITNIEIVNAVIRTNVKSLKTCGIKMVNGNPDVINVRIEFDNGCVANLNCSRITSDNSHYGLFTQQDRITKINFLNNEITIIRPEKVDKAISGKVAFLPVTRKVVSNNPMLDELLSFIFSIQNNSKLVSKSEDGFRSLYLADKIMDSLNKVHAGN
ncbi:MAG: Gfo/Idh/MocA family oxidoreductase [Bacteroidales bacterium]